MTEGQNQIAKELADAEIDLELALWEARAESMQNAVAALNAQGALLKERSAVVAANLQRCREAKKARMPKGETGPVGQPHGGGGPGEGDDTGGGP